MGSDIVGAWYYERRGVWHCRSRVSAKHEKLYAAAYHRMWIFKAWYYSFAQRFCTRVVLLMFGAWCLKFVAVPLTAESCQFEVSRDNSGVDVWYLIQLSFFHVWEVVLFYVRRESMRFVPGVFVCFSLTRKSYVICWSLALGRLGAWYTIFWTRYFITIAYEFCAGGVII